MASIYRFKDLYKKFYKRITPKDFHAANDLASKIKGRYKRKSRVIHDELVDLFTQLGKLMQERQKNNDSHS